MPVCSQDRATAGPIIRKVILEDGQNYMPIVVKVVQTTRKQQAANVLEYEDAIAEAFLGLAQAKARFKPKHKSKATLKSYAYWRMRGALLDSSTRELTYKTRNDNLDAEHLAMARHSDPHEVNLIRRQLIERMREAMFRVLSRAEFTVVVLSYLEEESDETVANMLHTSTQRVAALKRTGIDRLRMALGAPPVQ